ncbi:MAG: SDR family NAD(P)-dependent oxidoreductase [bacterium]|nr:SDR family NAD(P)-dependent oxidoreductase [bacterium]
MGAGERRGLEGRRIVLTGATGGIGRATALHLASGGARVLAIARGGEALASLSHEAKPLAGEIFPHPCDLTSESAVGAVAAAAGERLGGVDALVNNAGMAGFEALENLTPEAFEATLSVCLKAPYLLIRGLRPQLESSRGDVINISSIGAVIGFPGGAAYCAAKAGLEGMTRALVEELRPAGVRLTILRPGATATGLWRDIPGRFDLEKMVPPVMVAQAVEYLLRQSPRAWTELMTIYPPEGKVEPASTED